MSDDGRVLIAFSDGPLEAAPTWTRIDDPTGVTFPLNFVAGFDTSNGRQNLVDVTQTGTATVYLNDRDGLFDPRNVSSPYFGELDGKQVMCQIWNPVTSVWETQFRGLIDEADYTPDPQAVNVDIDPINVAIQLNCVDIFDYLAGYGLTPGIDGDTPPAGSSSIIYYNASGVGETVKNRIDAVMAGVGIDVTRYHSASGNTQLLAGKYDPDEAALTVVRDCADAELPFIANIYVDRGGKFVFRGRYSRFDPVTVSGEPGSDWDFNQWKCGDGEAIIDDSTRAQMRVLQYAQGRSNIINACIAYPQGLADADMPSQIYADTTSITDYGKHATQPLSELLTGDYVGPGTITPSDGKTQCQLFAELLVKNQKDPRPSVTSLEFRSINPNDARATATWAVLTHSDISDTINVAVGYPGGTGFTGDSPADDYYIEGRALTVRPANPDYDDVTLDLNVSPAVWSMDTHSVFPALS